MKHEIRLYGPIGGFFGFTADEILAEIPQDAKEVTLRIHSPGGSVGEGLAIYHALRDHSAKITTVVDGYAASSASFVMLAGDERQVHRNSIVFLHNPWTMAEGNADELRKVADGLDVHAEAILDIYKQRTGMDETALREMMDETAFFRGIDAKDNGFATGVIDDTEAEAQIAAMLKFEGLAAQSKGDTMSKQRTRKEIEEAHAATVQELDAVRAELTTEREDRAEGLEALATEHEAAILAKDEEIAALKTQADETAATLEEINGKLDEVKSEIEAKDAEIAKAQVDIQAKEAELSKAKAALKSPAVADAILDDAGEAAQAQLDAEASAAEKAAEAAEDDDKPKDVLEEYEAMEAGKDRQAFYTKNSKKIHALMAVRETEEG